MMKQPSWRAISRPTPSIGTSYAHVKKVVSPNMSMSLQTILERFTRGEPVNVGQEVTFDDESTEDLEKIKHADLVDKMEFVERQKDIQSKHKKQEAARMAAQTAQMRQQALDKIEAEEREKKAK